jgi:hypothetical protein
MGAMTSEKRGMPTDVGWRMGHTGNVSNIHPPFVLALSSRGLLALESGSPPVEPAQGGPRFGGVFLLSACFNK